MRIVRQMLRGCGELPHVGEHPGTVFLVAFLMMGAMAGGRGGLWGTLGGFLLMAFFTVPLYLYGAYTRAELSDKLERTQATRKH